MSRGLGDVYKRQARNAAPSIALLGELKGSQGRLPRDLNLAMRESKSLRSSKMVPLRTRHFFGRVFCALSLCIWSHWVSVGLDLLVRSSCQVSWGGVAWYPVLGLPRRRVCAMAGAGVWLVRPVAQGPLRADSSFQCYTFPISLDLC